MKVSQNIAVTPVGTGVWKLFYDISWVRHIFLSLKALKQAHTIDVPSNGTCFSLSKCDHLKKLSQNIAGTLVGNFFMT